MKAHRSCPPSLDSELFIDLVRTSLAPIFAPACNFGLERTGAASHSNGCCPRLSAEKEDPALLPYHFCFPVASLAPSLVTANWSKEVTGVHSKTQGATTLQLLNQNLWQNHHRFSSITGEGMDAQPETGYRKRTGKPEEQQSENKQN